MDVRFHPAVIAGAWLIEDDPRLDDRGWFSRIFCAEEFVAHGIDPNVAQSSLAYNQRTGTLRGLHFQRDPHGETKLIRCLKGTAFDVLADVRPESPTYRTWIAEVLSEERGASLLAPPGVAHGYLTLSDGCLLSYQMSVPYAAEAASGVRWDDPDLAIDWPEAPTSVSDSDRKLPLLSEIR